MNPKMIDPHDLEVVEFFNSTDFDFTPELGAMFDGRALFVGSGERRQFPYHIGHRLAVNLAKAVMIKGAPLHNPDDKNPTGSALWSEERLKQIENSFLTSLYKDERPIAMSETDKLMQRVAELEELFHKKEAAKPEGTPREPVRKVNEIVTERDPNMPVSGPGPAPTTAKTYADKAEVIAELEKRGIAHDKRKSKADLQKMLV